tara:strand:+ start:6860 stop:7705 length:846 start_codon:yes stop_codon:yes gene_type:complete
MPKNLFTYILGFTALFIAGNAAFFSVFGLSHLFAGAFWSVIIMASSLEVGKLVCASFIYRYWKKIGNLMRTYTLIGTILLMLITSIGIFGFLSKAFQGSTLEFEKLSTRLIVYEEQHEALQFSKQDLIAERDQQIEDLPSNYITVKKNLRTNYNEQINVVNNSLVTLAESIGDLKLQLVDTGGDVGPILYVAKVLNTDIDTVVKWLIFLLIIVFDPLAVCLIVAFNIVLLDKPRSKIESKIVRVPLAERGRVLPPTSVNSPPMQKKKKKAPKSSMPLSGRF